MRVVLDTNVLMSGIFFGGIPGQILDAWRKHHVSLVYTPSIFAEYQRVAAVLRRRYPQRDADPVLALLLSQGTLVQNLILPEPVSRDPDDDKFLACALSSGSAIIVSGDGDLLDVDGYKGIAVLKPREFGERYLGL